MGLSVTTSTLLPNRVYFPSMGECFCVSSDKNTPLFGTNWFDLLHKPEEPHIVSVCVQFLVLSLTFLLLFLATAAAFVAVAFCGRLLGSWQFQCHVVLFVYGKERRNASVCIHVTAISKILWQGVHEKERWRWRWVDHTAEQAAIARRRIGLLCWPSSLSLMSLMVSTFAIVYYYVM